MIHLHSDSFGLIQNRSLRVIMKGVGASSVCKEKLLAI